MILLTVLMVVLILSIFVAAIISQELSRSSGIQKQIDEIKAQELRAGYFWKAHAEMNAGNNPAGTFIESLDGKSFSVTVPVKPANSTILYDAATVTYN